MLELWIAGQQVERSILHQDNSHQNSSHYPRLSPAEYSLTSTASWPKTPFIHSWLLSPNVAGFVVAVLSSNQVREIEHQTTILCHKVFKMLSVLTYQNISYTINMAVS